MNRTPIDSEVEGKLILTTAFQIANDTTIYANELRTARQLARAAGAAALEFYGNANLEIQRKKADEPVTEADLAANNVIVPALRAAFPDDGMLSEESTDDHHIAGSRLERERVWMVDPLDGTQGFIDGTGDFAVQIGLSFQGTPVVGVVYKPVTNVLYAAARGAGAWVERAHDAPQKLHVSDRADLSAMRIAVSRSHRSPRMDRVIRSLGIREEIRSGSVGIKIGLIIENTCDLYVHMSPKSKQWDTCAPEAILREAGGTLTDLFGKPYRYNTPDVWNHNGIVATNGAAHAEVIARLAPLLAEFGRVRS